ncbi:hypothetical protein [Prauserella flavalba]|uniref:Uncharacterized protein n=1 Tax=Prauserella flavalba TaxID=1477506 RepID=A0A318M9H6_9PSEU|nr:hypothetical protein [Prauserella flavalba]PXY35459.1 hypothetical protein BA062_07965 [Prauserella flavalba]
MTTTLDDTGAGALRRGEADPGHRSRLPVPPARGGTHPGAGGLAGTSPGLRPATRAELPGAVTATRALTLLTPREPHRRLRPEPGAVTAALARLVPEEP